ncbi:hypothetical protein KA071_00910 [Candidatus Gracilibacteria bacterium]|nr:hypothetical protein [Candidatus Gracilibacteria bacterium]
MKKSFLGLLMLSVCSVTFAGGIEDALRSVGPGAIMAAGVGGFIALIGVILSYVATSYGTYLLAKKYAPKLHPAWSWIPVVQLYPLVVVSGQSPWWIAGILLGQFVPAIGGLVVVGSILYVFYHLSKRVGGDVGTMLLLFFFSIVMLPYLGLKAHKKSTTPAWILGVGAIIALVIGGGLTAASAARAMVSLEKQYGIMDKAQERMMEEIEKNPELQKQMQDARDAMMRIEQKTEVKAGVQ